MAAITPACLDCRNSTRYYDIFRGSTIKDVKCSKYSAYTDSNQTEILTLKPNFKVYKTFEAFNKCMVPLQWNLITTPLDHPIKEYYLL